MKDATNLDDRIVIVAGELHYVRSEAMRLLGRDRTTLWRWAKNGRITQRRHNGRGACYPVAEVHEIAAKNKELRHVS